MSAASVCFPWPRPGMRANGSHGHWSVKQRAKRADTADAYTVALAGGVRPIQAQRIAVSITFRPPDRRRRDADNMLSACKGLLDGLAQALGVDDSRWSLALEVGQPTPGGAVIVEWTIAQ